MDLYKKEKKNKAMKKIIYILTALMFSLTAMAQKENLGTFVNSDIHEISSYITPDGSKFFFVRSGSHPEHTMYGATQDIWMTHMENDSATTPGKHLKFPFNRTQYNVLCYQSADGQLRIIRGIYNRYMQFVDNGYSYSILKKNGWSNPKAIKIKDYENMTRGQYASMCMAPSGNVMILSFSETSGDEREYLYISRRITDSKWTRPEKMPFTVRGDFGPYMASDNRTLYFSSYEGREGYGDADVFVTKRLDDTWTNWSEPINLGPNINSEGREAYFKVSPTGRYAFVAGDAEDGSIDLFRVPLFKKEKPQEEVTEEEEEEVIVEEAKPDPIVIIEGIVKNAETGEPMQASLEYNNLSSGSLEGIARSSEIDGSYRIVVPYGSKYGIEAKKQGFYSENESVDLTEIGEFKTIKRDILMKPFKVEAVIRLNNIFFETAKSTLLDDSRAELDNLIEVLNDNPKMKIEIRGHTDNVGSDASNQVLSENRAKSVVAYLKEKGINANRLSSAGFGEKKPVESNDTEEGRAMNRRVEFRIISIK